MQRWGGTTVLLAVWMAGGTASAQDAEPSRDAEARSVFEAGTLAFEDARYADALGYFQRAYELSQRAVLLYNIGVAADRLRRDAVALEAFERFLESVPDHPRRRDVLARVEVLREAVAQGESSAPPPTQAETDVDVGTASPAATSGPDVGSLVGASALGAVGVASLIVGVVGIAGAGECLERAGDVCVEERGTAWEATGLYLGLGAAAITAAVIWIVVAASQGSSEQAAHALRVGPGGELTWTF